MKSLKNSFLFFLFSWKVCSAQFNVNFIEHLETHKLKTEHYTYLNQFSDLKPASDSISYFTAKFHLLYFNDSLLLKNMMQCKSLVALDTVFQIQASLKFLERYNFTAKSEVYRQRWFAESEIKINSETGRIIKSIFEASENPFLFNANAMPSALAPSFSMYKKASLKKPWLGAALSAAVPGLGKLYAGKKATALATFVLNAGYVAQNIESVHKLGAKHPLSIINLCAFAVFYASNIYGGYSSVVQSKQEYKKQFLIDAANLYN